jgi:hypothetical protein
MPRYELLAGEALIFWNNLFSLTLNPLLFAQRRI